MTTDNNTGKSAEQWYQMGLDRGRADDHDGAIEAYEQCVAQDPEHFRAWFNMGIRYGKIPKNVKAKTASKRP